MLSARSIKDKEWVWKSPGDILVILEGKVKGIQKGAHLIGFSVLFHLAFSNSTFATLFCW